MVGVVRSQFTPPPGWSPATDSPVVAHVAPGGAAQLLSYPVMARSHGVPAPGDWLDRLLMTELRGGFVELGHGDRTEIQAPQGMVGLAWEVVGGYGKPEDLIEKRTYAVLSDERALYPFALVASVAVHAEVVESFWRSVLSLRPY